MLEITSENRFELITYLRRMLLIRSFEERSAEQYMLGKIRGFLHLYIGEEAIAVGSISTLQPQDYIVTHYRDHGHALARGLHPNAIMAVYPADHLVVGNKKFKKIITNAKKMAENKSILITIGVKPTFPSTGYGYIQYNINNKLNIKGIYKVKTFAEKPDKITAGKFMKSGEYLWNSDIMSDLLYKISPDDGSVVATINSPGEHIWGLTFDGTYLWGSDISYPAPGSGIHYKIDIGYGGGSDVAGCTYIHATNYNSEATDDDGSCEFMWGDVNHDGQLTIQDLILIVNEILSF